jgi:hypothetical protein
MKKFVIVTSGLFVGALAALCWRSASHRAGASLGRPPTGATPAGTPRGARGTAVAVPAAERAPAPRFVIQSPQSQVQGNPLEAGYDPTVLAAIGRRLTDVWAAEPRVASWAGPMEKMLTTAAAEDLVYYSRHARVVGVECHSHSCMITAEVPEHEARAVDIGLQILRPGDVFEAPAGERAEQEGWRRLRMPVLFGSENHEVDAAASMQRKRRRAMLKELRADPKLLSQVGLNASQLPPSDVKEN